MNILKENKTTFENLFYDYLLIGEKNGSIPKGKNLKNLATLIYTLYSGIQIVAKVDADKSSLMASVETMLALLD